MLRSLVGSEMCIRDSPQEAPREGQVRAHPPGRQALPLLALLEEVLHRAAAAQARAHPHGGEALPVLGMREDFRREAPAEEPLQDSHGGETVWLRALRRSLQAHLDEERAQVRGENCCCCCQCQQARAANGSATSGCDERGLCV